MGRVKLYVKRRRLLEKQYTDALQFAQMTALAAVMFDESDDDESDDDDEIMFWGATMVALCSAKAADTKLRQTWANEEPFMDSTRRALLSERLLSDKYHHRGWFRMDRDQLLQVIDLFDLPKTLKTKSRHTVNTEKAWYALLLMISHDCTVELGCRVLDLTGPRISEHYLELLNVLQPYLARACKLASYAPYMRASEEAIKKRSPALAGGFAFIDGKVFELAQQSRKYWRTFQSGHKYRNGLNYLCCVLLNGMFCHASLPEPGSRTDIFTYQNQNIEEEVSLFCPRHR